MILKAKKKNKKFSLARGTRDLTQELVNLPTENECFKLISFGSFSSACFVDFVASNAVIDNLYISTFRVGKKEMLLLDKLHENNKLKNVNFVFCGLMETDKYPYFRILTNICNKNDWKFYGAKNHSKVFLFDTNKGKYVLETSSNLNENPKIEQFSFEQDDKLYNFYKEHIFDRAKNEAEL